MTDDVILPDYGGACVTNIVPALLDGSAECPSWMPPELVEASTVVLLVLDGLGWNQLQERRRLAPTLCGLDGQRITTVAPSTTATALTSISTGLTPGQHGVVGYRIAVEGEVLNVLRWSCERGDARLRFRPADMQKAAAFHGQRPPVLTRAEFQGGGFSGAHLEDVRFVGYRTPSTFMYELRNLLSAREPFVYAYYDGIDKVSHEYGLEGHYDAELSWCDGLVADVMAEMPRDSALVITADHGQVHTGDDVHDLPADVLEHVAMQSGEARFRWLHARAGRQGALLDAASERLGDRAWVHTRDEIVEAQWFGPTVTAEAGARLGDVALVAKGTAAFADAADTGPYHLIGRHGSLTPDEMWVPFLVAMR